jgi:hypothetical protein
MMAWCHSCKPTSQSATNNITFQSHKHTSPPQKSIIMNTSVSHHSSFQWLLVLLFFHQAHAFTNGIQDFVQRAFVPKADLQHIVSDSFPGTILDIQLDVADHASKQRMAVQNIVLQLNNKDDDKAIKQLPMPGFNGPHPSTSGGVGSIGIVEPGHFIDLTGRVKLQWASLASWELTWRQEAPAGTLICGLELACDAVRNKAKIPKGRIYMSFPVWNRDKLSEYQAYKVDWEAASKVHLRERDEQLLKMQQTNNILAKALHYRNAFAAVEQYSLQPHETMSKVPSNSEVITIADDILLSNKGTLWTKSEGNGFLSAVKQVRLGTAFIRVPVNVDEKRSGDVSTDISSLAP